MIRIILADDHEMVRDGLARLLDDEADCTVIATARDGHAALREIEQHRPDLLIVDLMMPGINGLEVTRQVTARFPTVRVIVLSMHADEAYVLEALRNGARGYVLKESNRTDLMLAIRTVMAGQRYLSAPLTERAIDTYLTRQAAPADDPYARLTTREREILHLLAQGRGNKEIAEQLTIGVRTVETHRANLLVKLNLRSQAEIIHYAYQRGLLK